jgi:hypothetical protein
MQKQELHATDMLPNSEMMYKSVMMGGMSGMEGRNKSRQKCGKHKRTGMNFDAGEGEGRFGEPELNPCQGISFQVSLRDGGVDCMVVSKCQHTHPCNRSDASVLKDE